MSDLKPGTDLVPAARHEGDAVILSARGEIDLHNSTELRGAVLEMLASAKPMRLIIDMSQVSYMDSSAIAVLVEALRKLRAVGGKLFLVAVQPRVRSVLEIAKLDKIFHLVATEADAR